VFDTMPSRSGEERLGSAEGLLHSPQLIVAAHDPERVEISVGAPHENANCISLASGQLARDSLTESFAQAGTALRARLRDSPTRADWHPV
jgi:hypothetical protein